MIAKYMRLSAADGDLDGDKVLSNSIANQHEIIDRFIERDEALSAMEAREFVDDGFSGSNFDRPAVQEMLDMCKTGDVTVVIVKDLSRFAREYIDAGTYIEQIFPFLGVRFIAIGDGFDSMAEDAAAEAPMVAVRNIANAAYCHDISVRIQSTYHTLWKRGKRPHGTPPFGYRIDEDDQRTLAIDDEAAPTVRRIFELAVAGFGTGEIARNLTAEGYERPGVLYRRLGLYGFDKRPEAKNAAWDTAMVMKIIQNPAYKGTLEAYKTHRLVMGRKPVRPTSPEERYVTELAHPAIVDEATWDAAQLVVGVNLLVRGPRGRPKSPFSKGFVQRAECGHGCKRCAREVMESYFKCSCDCAADDERRVPESEIAHAIAAALEQEVGEVDLREAKATEEHARTAVREASVRRLDAYERYVRGKGSIDDVSVSSVVRKGGSFGESGLASTYLASTRKRQLAELACVLRGGRFDEVDRELLRSAVERVLVHEGGRLEVVMSSSR